MGLISVLAEDSSYRPKLAVQTNRQAPFTYALPITAYEVDAQELVRHGIEIMLASLNNPKTSPEIRWLAPVRAESHESYLDPSVTFNNLYSDGSQVRNNKKKNKK